MGGLSILILVFVIIPGFLGDAVRRALFDDRKMTDFERTVRSVGISAFGLGLYVFTVWVLDSVGRAIVGLGFADWMLTPPYLAALAAPKGDQPVVINGHAMIAFSLHIVGALVVAVLWGKAANHATVQRLQKLILERTSEAPRTNTEPWRAFWRDYHPRLSYDSQGPPGPRRFVEVRTTGGERYKGLLVSAGDTSSAHDVVLGDPLLWIEEQWDWYSKGWKFVFIAGERIESIAMTFNPETETAHIGLLRSITQRYNTGGSDVGSDSREQGNTACDEAGTGDER